MTDPQEAALLVYPCCSADDAQPCPQAQTGHDLPCNGPFCRTVPESAKHACGKVQPHPAHDWAEQVGSDDYDQNWCVGVAPGATHAGARP